MKRILLSDIEYNKITEGLGTVIIYNKLELYREGGRVILVVSSAKPIKLNMMLKPFIRMSINQQLKSISSLFIDDISFKINQCLFTLDTLSKLSVKC